MNKFEQVSSDDHKMSLAGGRARTNVGARPRVGARGSVGGGPSTVSSNASWVMVAWESFPLDRMTDRDDRKLYLTVTSLGAVTSCTELVQNGVMAHTIKVSSNSIYSTVGPSQEAPFIHYHNMS